MPRSKIYLAAGFLLVAVSIFAVWQPQDSTLVEPITARNTDNSQVADPPKQAEPIADESQSVRNIDVSAAQLVEASAKTTSLPLQPAYEGDDGVLISGVDIRSDEAVPHVDLFILDRDEFYRIRNSMKPGTDDRHTLFILRKHGMRYQSDGDGIARIPPPQARQVVAAENGELVGIDHGLKVTMKEFSFTMRPRYPLTAYVFDASGEPVAGVPIAIQYTYHSRFYVGPVRRTDAKGKAHFYSISMLTQKEGGPTKFFARLEFPVKPAMGHDPERIELTNSILEKGEVTLTMPETGGVRVRVIDENGEPVSSPGMVAIHTQDWSHGAPTDQHLEKEVVDGVVEFPFIGVGTSLTASFEQEGGRNKDYVKLDGPSRAGEWVEAEIVASNWPYLTGLLLDADGLVLANHNCELESFRTIGQRETSGQYRIKTDDEGRFRVELGRADEAHSVSARRGVFTADLPNIGASRAEAIIPHPLMPGGNDIGEITFVSTQPRLAGRVLNEKGDGVAAAMIQIRPVKPKSQNEGGISIGSDGGISIGGSRSRTRLSGETDSQGAFALYGEMDDVATYQVTIRAKGYQPLTQEVPAGTQGVEFVLLRAGILAGTVLIDDGIPVDSLWFMVQSPGVRNVYVRLEQTNEPGRYTFQCDVEVGPTYQFVARTRMGEDLFILDSLSFLPGQVSRPPALQPLDLRGMIKAIHFIVQDSEGNRMSAGYSVIEGNRSTGSDIDAGGTTLLTTGEGFSKMEIRASGYRTVTLLDVRTDQVITMEPALSIVLQLPNEIVGHHGKPFHFLLKRVDSPQPLHSGYFDAKGKAQAFVPSPGEYLVDFQFTISSAIGSFFSHVDTYTIQVAGGEGQVAIVPVDQAVLDAKIDAVDND